MRQDALIGAEKALTEKTDLAAVGVTGQHQIGPRLGIVTDPLRAMGKEYRAGVWGNELLHLPDRGLFTKADHIYRYTVPRKGHLFIFQNTDAALGQLHFDLWPVAYPPFMIPLNEIHRPQLGRFPGKCISVFPLFRQVTIQQVAGDGDAIEGKARHGMDHGHTILPIGTVVKV